MKVLGIEQRYLSGVDWLKRMVWQLRHYYTNTRNEANAHEGREIRSGRDSNDFAGWESGAVRGEIFS